MGGEEGEEVVDHPHLAVASPAEAPLMIPAHLLFNLTLCLLIASYRMLLNMHINAHACSHIGSHLLRDEFAGQSFKMHHPTAEANKIDDIHRWKEGGKAKERADKGRAMCNRALLWLCLMDLWVMLTFCHRGGFTPL